MYRANVVLLSMAVSLLLGTNAAADGASLGHPSGTPQSMESSTAAPNQSDMTMNVPLVVLVDTRGQVRDIQHWQRLPPAVNNLLWQSVKSWTKSPAVVNGKPEAAQVFMNVTLHTKTQADGHANVYFTLASEGPVLRGYWRLTGNNLVGHCALGTSDPSAGTGGKVQPCAFQLTAGVMPAESSPEGK
ncbi:hypothetical protein DWU98_15685 [Dyella monticola]|uniref:Uncharacterized protein n=1 Tax=Dyella monticola TaxID=1927958 RepID=A0A370WUT2_9GAMM|nr:hypothetical protein [Dyella monticola]RDS79882.1 hypothetical protein DWU98_15685 [Dyella monticola]